MKLDALPPLREDAERRINEHFDGLARSHLDAEHRRKREVVSDFIRRVENRALVDGDGVEVPAEIQAYADTEGLGVQEFMKIVSSKPDLLAARAVARRRAVLAVRAATTEDQIEAAVAQATAHRE